MAGAVDGVDIAVNALADVAAGAAGGYISAGRKASCGALGGHFRWRQPWLAMVVLVVVGHWRLMSDQPTV